jgi:hypothetical protein
MVSTGDQPVDSVSRHMAPYSQSIYRTCQASSSTYSLTAHIGVPDFGSKFHDGWSERIFARDIDIDFILASLIWCPWRAAERAFQLCDILAHGFGVDVRLGVRVKVGKFLGDSAGLVRGHRV